MRLPKPEPGLVVRYAYLWFQDHLEGREEGRKDRPCAIVLATLVERGRTRALVVPITHRQPDDPRSALELPASVKRHLGLDMQRSWVITESNLFMWPGPDLRRIGEDPESVAYGFLPPRFFVELRRRFTELDASARSRRISRTE